MQRQSLARGRAQPMILCAFEGANDSYALARDHAKLPSEGQPWRPVGEIDVKLADHANFGVDVHRIAEDIGKAGFHAVSRHEVLYLPLLWECGVTSDVVVSLMLAELNA